jgi:hypothetical protein
LTKKTHGEDAAEHGTDRRADDDADGEDRLSGGLLFGRKRLAQDRLRSRDQAPAAETLDHPPKHERLE